MFLHPDDDTLHFKLCDLNVMDTDISMILRGEKINAIVYENEDGKYFVGSNRKKVYETYDEVFEFACNKKKERIEKVAENNLVRIPKCAYDAMLRYDVEALIRRDVIAA